MSNEAVRTPQFWLLWGVLCLNVSAGIGVIGMASPMLQEVFGGQLSAYPVALAELSETSARKWQPSPLRLPACCRCSISPGALSGHRFRTIIGRKVTYTVFFLLGMAL